MVQDEACVLRENPEGAFHLHISHCESLVVLTDMAQDELSTSPNVQFSF